MFKKVEGSARFGDRDEDGLIMGENKPLPSRRSVATPSGRISYLEQGTGPTALFVHGVLLNGHLWRHQLAELSDIRRCVAVDLLAHGDTEISWRSFQTFAAV
jgi:pimeloyl-ACP methyl ester carboxylesterase